MIPRFGYIAPQQERFLIQRLRKLRPLFLTARMALAAAAPANASPPQTGEITLNITQRSRMSSRKEVVRVKTFHPLSERPLTS